MKILDIEKVLFILEDLMIKFDNNHMYVAVDNGASVPEFTTYGKINIST